ncbi:MAG: uroporphyrinogen-III C-methyltransferase [Rhodospirillaceae bacterium]|jgi:uroporphyrin-III C-methyltransferase|nr:uroporphyrinogen-III C-methyltransferase [Rhodospirillaceae bacterium]MDP6645601.1 uroporphyrinogen-III C-methyltransferase [Rhodospirillales bacterium]
MENLPIELPEFEPGSVWLVGAGPGDPGLLSIAGLHAMQTADVIVYDALVGADVMKLAGPDAELVHAGKRGGKPSPRQEDITEQLVRLARGGKRVLRLKGGDPFVFGRGAEECARLFEAGVRFRIVPGITAGVGGLAYAGIPMTTRGKNIAVTFITGHTAGGDVPDDLDWPALAAGSPVLIFYMGATHLDRIAAKLMDAGRAADEPVALISRATLPDQRVLETTLAACAEDLKEAALNPPTLIVVGPVVSLREQLNWLGL